jgi:Protein of unknown function (DUF1376)
MTDNLIGTLPFPLTPADCDLRDFQFMPLDVVRLRDSDSVSVSTAEEFRCAVLLWCAAWHQVPAASLPDDDRVLSKLAGYGRVVHEWNKVRVGAMRGWIKCSDGRMYHPVVAEKANESWGAKHRHAYEKLEDRVRKRNKKRAEIGLASLEIPDFETWVEQGFPLERELFPPEKPVTSSGTPSPRGGIPEENALKGEGQGQGHLKHSGGGSSQGSDCANANSSPHSAALIDILQREGISVTAGDIKVEQWAARGATRDDVMSAIATARQRRGRDNSNQPINVGFLGGLVIDAIAVRTATGGVAFDAPPLDWWANYPGVENKGKELGIPPIADDENALAFRLRVLVAAGPGKWQDAEIAKFEREKNARYVAHLKQQFGYGDTPKPVQPAKATLRAERAAKSALSDVLENHRATSEPEISVNRKNSPAVGFVRGNPTHPTEKRGRALKEPILHRQQFAGEAAP